FDRATKRRCWWSRNRRRSRSFSSPNRKSSLRHGPATTTVSRLLTTASYDPPVWRSPGRDRANGGKQKDRGHHGRGQRHRTSHGAGVVRGRLLGGIGWPSARHAGGNRDTGEGDAAGDAGGADRRRGSGANLGVVPDGQGDLWEDRPAVQ